MTVAQSDDLEAKMQQAVDMIGEAEFYEKSGDIENAIAKYEEAAHLLSQANFPHDRILEVYNHINLLKEAMRSQSIKKASAKEQESHDSETEAFALIDDAEAKLKSGDLDGAIASYQSAVPKLEKAGYSIDPVQEKIKDLTGKLQQRRVAKPSYKAVTPQPATFIKPAGAARPAKPVKMAAKPMKPAGMHKPEIIIPQEAAPEMPVKVDVEQETVPDTTAEMEKLEAFKETREKTDEMERKAFELLDKAKDFMENEQFVDALSTYGMITNMLKNAGWDEDQLEPILTQENLVKEILEAQDEARSNAPAIVSEGEGGEEEMPAEVPRIVRQKLDLYMDQDTKMRKFKEAQSKKQNLEGDAFGLMDEAQKKYKFGDVKDYPGAIQLYQRAMKLLEKAGWTDQVAYVAIEIERLQALNNKALDQMEMAEAAEERKKEEFESRKKAESQKKQAVESDLKSVSSMLGKIEAQKKKQKEMAEEEDIKQKLIEEKKYKELISARSTGKKSFESIKDMLFGDKDAIAAAEHEKKKKQIEQDFISNTSKRYYDFKQTTKEQETSPMESVEQMVDYVHKGTVSTQPKAKARANVADPKKKQEMEVKQQQEEKEKAVGDVLSMLGAMKKDKKEAKKAPKEPAVQDEELKQMFTDLKKKKH